MSKENDSVMKKAFSRLWEDIRAAKWVIIFIIAYFVLAKTFLHSICPAVWLSGFPCPACGLTRAGILLLKLDLAGAFKVHPFIYPIAGILAVFIGNRYILMRKAPEWLKWCAILVIIAMVLFYIWRMYQYFPGEPPISYYTNNLICRLSRWVQGF